MDIREMWKRTCAELKAVMNSVTYLTWIEGNLTPVSLENNTLTLLVSIDNMKVVITNKYSNIIEEALRKVTKQPIEAVYVTKTELANIKSGVKSAGDISQSTIPLNPKYTFDTFVVGSNNRFAHAAALAVAEMQGDVYNPLFIYGGVGLGKTHLMHAIGHFVQENYPEKKLIYITCEDFTNDLITSIQLGRNQQFRDRFRNADYLMVDDIQFIAGKESTQEEFFHTFNALQTAGKQIILTSDRPPLEIAKLSERLSSRFAGGLTCDIKKPDFETRIAILRRKVIAENLDVTDAALEVIATCVDSNIRELEGALTRIVARAKLYGQPKVTEEIAHEELKSAIENKANREVTPDMIISAVSEYYSLTPADLTGSSRKKDVVVPRQIAIYLTREMLGMSLPQIGALYGGRDHTTVLHSYDAVRKNVADSANYASRVGDIRNMITEGR